MPFIFPIAVIFCKVTFDVPGGHDHIFKQQWQLDPSAWSVHQSLLTSVGQTSHTNVPLDHNTRQTHLSFTENHHHHYGWEIKAFSWHWGFLLVFMFDSHYKANSPLQGKGPADIISFCTSVWGGITSCSEVNKGELNGHGGFTVLFIAFKARTVQRFDSNYCRFCGFIQAFDLIGWGVLKYVIDWSL